MVTSILNTPTYSDEHDVFLGNSRVSIEQPLICVDGYILACRYDGESCNPTFGINIVDLLNAVRTEMISVQESKSIPLSTSPTKPPSPSLAVRRTITTMQHPLTYSRRRLFRQNSRDNNNKKRDSEDLTGVTYDHIDHSTRDSFILPISNAEMSPIKTRQSLLSDNDNNDNTLLSDINENIVNNADLRRQEELELQIEWVKKHCSDYINTETVTNCTELKTLLDVLMKVSTAALVTLKIVNSNEITVTYQFMEQFKRNYMFIKINPGYAMLMKAF